MGNDQTEHETRGVTVELLAAVDLGAEIEGMAGRQLRMRMVTIAPGGVFGPLHDHVDRPGIVYMLQGTITDPVSYTHLRAHETVLDTVCRLLLAKKTRNIKYTQ